MLSNVIRHAVNTKNRRPLLKGFCSSGLPLSRWRTFTTSSIWGWGPVNISGNCQKQALCSVTGSNRSQVGAPIALRYTVSTPLGNVSEVLIDTSFWPRLRADGVRSSGNRHTGPLLQRKIFQSLGSGPRTLHCTTNTSSPQDQTSPFGLSSHPSPDDAAESGGASHTSDVLGMPLHEGQIHGGGETETGPKVQEKDQKLLQVAIVGVPNAGKSTLTNALVGHKVSAVSPKTNTTSVATLGAFMEGAAQVVMYDTPGLVTKRYIRSGLHEGRVQSAWGIAAESDMLLLIIDGERQLTAPDPRVISLVKNLSSKLEPCPATVLVLNKIDKIGRSERPRLLNLIRQLSALHNFSDVFLVSATQLKGVPELQEFLLSRATPARWLLEPRQKTDVSEQDQAREIVREQIFMRMYKEVPYNVQLTLEDWKPFEDGSLRAEFILSTPNEQIRRMLIGKKGAVIGEMGIKARKELESLLGRRVHLILTAKTV